MYDLKYNIKCILEYVYAIGQLSENDEPIHCLNNEVLAGLNDILAGLDCCKQHWLHGGECQ